MSPLAVRLGLGLAAVAALTPLLAGLPGPSPEFFKGKVVPLAEVLKKAGVRLDADAAPHWLALVGDDGKVLPLIKDDGARLFFKDARLLHRPMRLTGHLLADGRLLQVVQVHSYHHGKLHEVYYWCDICAIKRFEKQICDCCGGPMELKEEPAAD